MLIIIFGANWRLLHWTEESNTLASVILIRPGERRAYRVAMINDELSPYIRSIDGGWDRIRQKALQTALEQLINN